MTKLDKEKVKNPSDEDNNREIKDKEPEKKITPEDELKTVQEKLLRSMAEIENQRRRFEKEKQEAFEFGGFNFARESLTLIDNLDRAVVSFKNDENLKNFKDLNKIIDGIEIVKKDLISVFKKNGIQPIECINKKFDPNLHQAVSKIHSNLVDGIIVQELQKGFMIGERLLRPSMVVVSMGPEKKK